MLQTVTGRAASVFVIVIVAIVAVQRSDDSDSTHKGWGLRLLAARGVSESLSPAAGR